VPAEAEAVLFGRGDMPGLLDQADDGTLFIDEVADLAAPLQARLLGVVEGRRYVRAGSPETRHLKARIVVATNADLHARAQEGRFRRDLLFRLSVVELCVPPLRDRPEDLIDLAQHFIEHFSHGFGGATKRFAEDAVDALLVHAWPGNLRELRNRIERAVLLAASDEIGRVDLFPEQWRDQPDGAPGAAPLPVALPGTPPPEAGSEPASLAEARDLAEREHIRRVLARCRGRIGDAARVLGVSRTTLWDRMRRLGLPAR
jgi:DNA-binding NtrC family response regulator